MNRDPKHAAALELHAKWAEVSHPCRAWGHETDDAMEETFRRAAEKAAKELADYRLSRALWAGIQALLPGAFHVDVSDFLPREKWYAFVSNSSEEWIEWLVGNGVPRKDAESLVRRDR